MEKTSFTTNETIQFWDKNAKWYKLWIEHNNYHNEIIKILTSFVNPGWKVLDIGAGNGILSLPLCAIDCKVTALEPSEGMRKLLQKEALKRNIGFLSIDRRRWEDVLRIEFRDYDLVIACNSLHLTQIAFKDAFEKIFGLRPKNIFLVAESHFSVIPIGSHYEDYTMLFAEYFEAESSFAYHDMKEILEHWVFKNDRYPSYFEQVEIQSKLSFRNGHYWMDDIASVGMFWWKKNAEYVT